MEQSRIGMIRVQRRRVKGWRMPENTVYVGRPSKWGNPFAYSLEYSLYQSLEKYQKWLGKKLDEDPNFLKPLEGKNLACWCPLTRTCHADILLAIVKPLPRST